MVLGVFVIGQCFQKPALALLFGWSKVDFSHYNIRSHKVLDKGWGNSSFMKNSIYCFWALNSHNLSHFKDLKRKKIWFSRGKIKHTGRPGFIIRYYTAFLFHLFFYILLFYRIAMIVVTAPKNAASETAATTAGTRRGANLCLRHGILGTTPWTGLFQHPVCICIQIKLTFWCFFLFFITSITEE